MMSGGIAFRGMTQLGLQEATLHKVICIIPFLEAYNRL